MPKRNGHSLGIVTERPIPQPDDTFDGKLFDPRGNTVRPATHNLMARLNERSKDDFTVTKGMATIIAILLTAAGLFLGYVLPSIREGGRESEKVVGIERDMQQTREEMKELNGKFDELQKALTAQALKDAETKGKELGYSVGRADQKGGH